MTVLNGEGRPVFDTIEGSKDTGDRCAKVPDFSAMPAQIALAIGDRSGIDRVVVRALFGDIVDSSIVSAPASTVHNARDGATDVAVITFTPATDGSVLTGALVLFDLGGTPPVALTIAADDIGVHRGQLYQVDIRGTNGDAALCRGQR